MSEIEAGRVGLSRRELLSGWYYLTIVDGSITLTAAQLAGLAITPANHGNFSLSFVATATDGGGYHYTATSTETVTVAPPVNHAPTITSADPQAGVVTSGLIGSSDPDEVSGSLDLVDPDRGDHHTVTVSAPSFTTTSTASIPSTLGTALASAFSVSVNDSTGSGNGQINWDFNPADSNFDFLGKQRYFVGLSVVLLIAGLVSLVLKGGPRYGIDFKGGTLRALPDDRIAQMAFLNAAGDGPATSGDDAFKVPQDDGTNIFVPILIPLTDFSPAPDLHPGGADVPK